MRGVLSYKSKAPGYYPPSEGCEDKKVADDAICKGLCECVSGCACEYRNGKKSNGCVPGLVRGYHLLSFVIHAVLIQALAEVKTLKLKAV